MKLGLGLVIALFLGVFTTNVARADDGLDCGAKKKTCFADGGDSNCICVEAAEYVANPEPLDPNDHSDEAPADH